MYVVAVVVMVWVVGEPSSVPSDLRISTLTVVALPPTLDARKRTLRSVKLTSDAGASVSWNSTVLPTGLLMLTI